MAKRIWRAARTGQSTVDNPPDSSCATRILRVKSLRRGRKENEKEGRRVKKEMEKVRESDIKGKPARKSRWASASIRLKLTSGQLH